MDDLAKLSCLLVLLHDFVDSAKKSYFTAEIKAIFKSVLEAIATLCTSVPLKENISFLSRQQKCCGLLLLIVDVDYAFIQTIASNVTRASWLLDDLLAKEQQCDFKPRRSKGVSQVPVRRARRYFSPSLQRLYRHLRWLGSSDLPVDFLWGVFQRWRAEITCFSDKHLVGKIKY